MAAKNYFGKSRPTFFERNPKSEDEINKEFLQQLCWDGQMDDGEIDEFVKTIIKWKNDQCDRYYKYKREQKFGTHDVDHLYED